MVDKAEVWRERLAACRASGLSTAAYCRERDLAYAQYMYWQRRLGARAHGLVPVRIDAPVVAFSVDVSVAGSSLRVGGMTVADVVALVRGLSC